MNPLTLMFGDAFYLPRRFQSPNLRQVFFSLLQAPTPNTAINYSQLLHTFILLAWPKGISVCNLLFSKFVLGLATRDQLVLYQNKGKLQFLPQTTSTTSKDTLSELSPKERVKWCSDPDTPNGQNVGAFKKRPRSSIFHSLLLPGSCSYVGKLSQNLKEILPSYYLLLVFPRNPPEGTPNSLCTREKLKLTNKLALDLAIPTVFSQHSPLLETWVQICTYASKIPLSP